MRRLGATVTLLYSNPQTGLQCSVHLPPNAESIRKVLAQFEQLNGFVVAVIPITEEKRNEISSR